MVRRYHLAYESVTGEKLSRDPATNGRLVTAMQLATLEQARNIVKETNGVVSAEDAVRQVLGVITTGTNPVMPQAEIMQAMVDELRRINTRLELIETENKILTSTVGQLQKQLEAPKDNDELDTRVLKLVNESLRQQNAKLEVEASKKWWQRLVNLMME
jgi:phage-related protein